jgi:SAM-dependent methyltransferase
MKKKLLERLSRREQKFNLAVAKLRAQIETGVIGGEPDRLWLDGHAKGKGLDMCCGDFPIKGAEGVDVSSKKIGADFLAKGDELTFVDNNSLDFVVTNYLDVFPDTLKVLNEWYRILKSGGRLALVCRNADAYLNPLGPLDNSHRVSLFTMKTIQLYLERAGFCKVTVVADFTSLRVTASK